VSPRHNTLKKPWLLLQERKECGAGDREGKEKGKEKDMSKEK
jgi:hypothetical protein